MTSSNAFLRLYHVDSGMSLLSPLAIERECVNCSYFLISLSIAALSFAAASSSFAMSLATSLKEVALMRATVSSKVFSRARRDCSVCGTPLILMDAPLFSNSMPRFTSRKSSLIVWRFDLKLSLTPMFTLELFSLSTKSFALSRDFLTPSILSVPLAMILISYTNCCLSAIISLPNNKK